jgi:hypothetical protein
LAAFSKDRTPITRTNPATTIEIASFSASGSVVVPPKIKASHDPTVQPITQPVIAAISRRFFVGTTTLNYHESDVQALFAIGFPLRPVVCGKQQLIEVNALKFSANWVSLTAAELEDKIGRKVTRDRRSFWVRVSILYVFEEYRTPWRGWVLYAVVLQYFNRNLPIGILEPDIRCPIVTRSDALLLDHKIIRKNWV